MPDTTEPMDAQSEVRKILELVIRVDERQGAMGLKVDRIDKAIFGNGQPGLSANMADLQRRVEAVEAQEGACPIGDIVLQMAEMRNRHKAEDDVAKEKKEDEKDDLKERRKGFREFKWGMTSAITLLVIDIVLRLFNIIK